MKSEKEDAGKMPAVRDPLPWWVDAVGCGLYGLVVLALLVLIGAAAVGVVLGR